MRIGFAIRSISVVGLSVLAACGGGGGGGSTPTPTPTPTFTIGGTLSGLATGASVVLQNSGGNNLTVNANGSFTFSNAVSSGGAYAVTVLTAPSSPNQTCTVTNGSGNASANVTNVAVACSTTTHTIGGTVSGLTGTGLVLQSGTGQTLNVSASGNFTFPTALASGSTYAVTVQTQPSAPTQACTVTSGAGTIGAANVSNIAVNCATSAFTLGGTVSGLAAGGTVVLRNNNANDLTVSANGAFTFAGNINSGTNYAETVLTQPTVPGPGQTCTVTPGTGTGTIAGAAVSSVAVSCANNDVTAPTVTARTPLPTAVGTKLQGGVVTVTFSEAIKTTSVNTTSFSVQGPAGPVSGAISFAGGNTQATFTPTAPLDFDASYTVTLSTAIQDPSSNPLGSAVTWSFNTGKKLALGFQHACARFVDGRVKCWGANSSGQLGLGDNFSRGDSAGEVPNNLAAVNLGTGRTAVALAAGDNHTCAILDNGDTKCWGENSEGELGQGRIDNGPSFGLGDEPNEMGDNLAAINLGVGRRAIELAPGQAFTCARLDDNSVKCWGLNNNGQLGQGNTTSLGVTAGDIAAAPAVSLGAGLTPIQISSGHYHVCAILQDGAGAKSVKCWGDNLWGQLGQGDTSDRGDGANEMGANLPTVNLGAAPTYLMATGGHTCALLSNAAVKCWGLNTWGQVGLNAGNSSPAAGGARLVCSGGANDCIGDQANEMGSNLLAAIGSGVSRISVGFRHSCALLSNGQLKCWGSNEDGQLGLGTIAAPNDIIGNNAGEIAALATTALTPSTTIEEFSAGGFFNCVWNTNDSLNCWGDNASGQLGHNNVADWGDDAGEMGANLIVTDLGL